MRLYNVVAINERTGKHVLLTGYPMPHKECCTMLSKMTGHKDTMRMLIEVKQGAKYMSEKTKETLAMIGCCLLAVLIGIMVII